MFSDIQRKSQGNIALVLLLDVFHNSQHQGSELETVLRKGVGVGSTQGTGVITSGVQQ